MAQQLLAHIRPIAPKAAQSVRSTTVAPRGWRHGVLFLHRFVVCLISLPLVGLPNNQRSPPKIVQSPIQSPGTVVRSCSHLPRQRFTQRGSTGGAEPEIGVGAQCFNAIEHGESGPGATIAGDVVHAIGFPCDRCASRVRAHALPALTSIPYSAFICFIPRCPARRTMIEAGISHGSCCRQDAPKPHPLRPMSPCPEMARVS